MKFAYIEWRDHWGVGGWTKLDYIQSEMDKGAGLLIKSLGIVVYETESEVALAVSIGSDSQRADGIVVILKENIIKRKAIKL